MSEVFALLDDNYHENGRSYLFTELVKWVKCEDLAHADEALSEIEASEHFAAGFISYEFARHFGYMAKPIAGDDLPFLQFGLFRKKTELSSDEVDAFLAERFGDGQPFLSKVTPQISAQDYSDAITQIKSELEAGNSYQVNYTFETKMKQGGCPFRFYNALRKAQAVPYGAFLNFESTQVLSRSPELFFRKESERITCKPMKGTEPRARDATQDQIYRSHLVASPKQRAENLMIVDLLRNDLSQIAELGSVEVKKLYEVETYETVFQLTSTIHAEVKDKGFSEILKALFPCGSITGAPKLITTQIIDRLEPNPRGVYCGAIGYVEPKGKMVFNVPIRTLTLQNREGRFSVGGGVVYDSVHNKEYDEALLKGKFLLDLPCSFELLDSHYFSPERGAPFLDAHIARLKQSANELRFSLDENALRSKLDTLYQRTNFEAKIRVTLSQAGEINLSVEPIEDFFGKKIVVLSDARIDQNDPIFAYKTTNRAFYNREFKQARALGAYDVLFANQRGELAEAAIHNLVLRMGGEYLTPPTSSGALPGIACARALQIGKITEAVLPISALDEADEIFLINSVRGWQKVSFQAS